MSTQPSRAVWLGGFTVGITADRRWEEQAALFERRGAAIQHGPVIRTHALGDDDRLRAATDAVIARRPAIAIANTGLGIRSWFSAAETWGLGDALTDVLRGARIFARGPKAVGAALAHGLDVEACVPTARLHDVVSLAIDAVRPGDVVVLQLDGRGPGAEAARLTAAGADVIEVPVYVWELPDDDGSALRLAEDVVAGRVHALTFTAGPAVRNFMTIARSHGIDGDVRARLTDGSVVVGCVGPVCADAARDVGLADAHLVVPATSRLGPLVRCVSESLAGRAIRVDLAGTTMVLAGTVVTLDGLAITLTDIESQVLRALASRPNVVIAKSDLLDTVWRDRDADPHVVETVVTRLRRRMGPLGRRIGAVYRRGYVLRT